jgi:hypothetical protein
MSLLRSTSLARCAAAVALASVLGLTAVSPTARADEAGACEGFAWPLDTERSAFANATIREVESGAKLSAADAQAFLLKLKPEADVQLVAPASGMSKAQAASPHAGVVTVEGGTGARTVQVTISDEAWIDVIQNGAVLTSTAHTGKKGCAELRKSVQFKVGPGDFSVQLTGAPSAAVKVSLHSVN